MRQILGKENELSRDADVKTQNTEIFQEMIETEYLERVPESYHYLPLEKHFVMSHHPVWKSISTTTKSGAVFNASAKTTKERSQQFHPGWSKTTTRPF